MEVHNIHGYFKVIQMLLFLHFNLRKNNKTYRMFCDVLSSHRFDLHFYPCLCFEGEEETQTGCDRFRFVANANGPGTIKKHSEDGRGV